jgi:flavodoxin
MASILRCYGTGEGQTEKVADHLADAFATFVEERIGDTRGTG